MIAEETPPRRPAPAAILPTIENDSAVISAAAASVAVGDKFNHRVSHA